MKGILKLGCLFAVIIIAVQMLLPQLLGALMPILDPILRAISEPGPLLDPMFRAISRAIFG